MACQSLDNDKILNVCWATEDLNPVQKVAEKCHLEDVGQEAICAQMDPRIVDAMQAVRALEDGDVLTEDSIEPTEQDMTQLDMKRPCTEVVLISNTRDQAPKPTSILNEDMLKGLKYFVEIRERFRYVSTSTTKSAPPTVSGLNLVDYNSDDE